MKKLMIAAVAIVFATVTQAASIIWGGAISEPDGETEVAANTMAYLIFSDSAFSADGATFDGSDLVKDGATIASSVSTHAISGTEAGNWEFAEVYGNPGNDVNGYYAVLVSDNGATPKYSFYDIGEITGTTSTSPAANVKVSWDDGWLTQDGYTVSGGGPGPEPVPEPTSGLLLLLGMAGLALKRKCA